MGVAVAEGSGDAQAFLSMAERWVGGFSDPMRAQAVKHTNRQTNERTDKRTNGRTKDLSGRLADAQAGKQTGTEKRERESLQLSTHSESRPQPQRATSEQQRR